MLRLLLFISCLLVSTVVVAHQLKHAETTVLFNPRTSNIELMHRFYLHDTEHAVARLFGKSADILDNPADQQRFSSYVAKQVALKTLDDKPLALKTVGQQIDGKFLWVYQETATPKTTLKGLKMSHGALQELWPAQVNMVNFEGKGKVKTLHFNKDNDWLTVIFDK